mmetsp:Transcript_7883/g.14298  ORF Transcript_7883/g.14298 Transcript_7883/m.14298 type:complete len:321 (-) Transcript_7883:593-1555(-)
MSSSTVGFGLHLVTSTSSLNVLENFSLNRRYGSTRSFLSTQTACSRTDSNPQSKHTSISMVSRRSAMIQILSSLIPLVSLQTQSAFAMNGLVMFPLIQPLSNRYILMHAGQTRADIRNIVCTNPVEKLSIDIHGLTSVGVKQTESIAEILMNEDSGVLESGKDLWIWPSQTISCLQTADILAYKLGLFQSRVVPEFSFLDARGFGVYEGLSMKSVENEIMIPNDSKDSYYRPPPGNDGTPNDSLQDVFVRVRQLISKTETQYSDADVLIIAPDWYTLAVLECSLIDEPLTNIHKYRLNPGQFHKIIPTIRDPPKRPTLPL